MPGASVSPSRHSEEECVELNQGPYEEAIGSYGILEIANERTSPSRFDNLTFDPSPISDSFNNTKKTPSTTKLITFPLGGEVVGEDRRLEGYEDRIIKLER